MRKQEMDALKMLEALENTGSMASKAGEAYAALLKALSRLELNRPNDRSAIDRHYAVTITELEKAIAYFKYWVVDDDFIKRN